MLSRDSLDFFRDIHLPGDYKSPGIDMGPEAYSLFPSPLPESDFYLNNSYDSFWNPNNAFTSSKPIGLNSFEDIYQQYMPKIENDSPFALYPENSYCDEFVDKLALSCNIKPDKYIDNICAELEKYTGCELEKYSACELEKFIYASSDSESFSELLEGENTSKSPLLSGDESEHSLIDSVPDFDSVPDPFDKNPLLIPPKEVFNQLCESIVPEPDIKIKEEVCQEDDELELDILRKEDYNIISEHSYSSMAQRNDRPVVKKRKKEDDDDDYNPNEKPKRKVGRPRIHKPNPPKTQRPSFPRSKTPKRVTQASKKLKSCSTVPFDRREQHNQAERERRDMLKKNLDFVEDITPDHVLELTQLALQSEKTIKSDDFENNENNFTVEVLKKLDELMKKEPTSHRPKNKKSSRKSKMVVLLGSTYYIGSLERDLKIKENRLAQLKKQYEDCLKRCNPTKISSKKVRRNYQ